VITPEHRQAAAQVAALLEARLAAKAAPPATPRPWSKFELSFYTLLRQILRDEAAALAQRAEQGGPSAINDSQWWTLHEATLIDELTNSLGQVARYGAQAGRAALAEPQMGINWGLVNRSAVDWEEQHAGELVRQIEPVTRAGLQQVVSEWALSGESLPVLAEKIRALSDPATGTVFSPQRARMIAQTESTNAFAQGNILSWVAAGVAPAAFWPAAHPNCRCYLEPYRLKDGTFVMVWFTAEDERVCTRPINTPWGTVDGCAALHGVIVSHGAYMGQQVP